MKYLVKDTPIRKNKKTYGVGEIFPYSDKDKSLLTKGYLTEVKAIEKATKTKVASKNLPAKSSKAGKTNSKKKK